MIFRSLPLLMILQAFVVTGDLTLTGAATRSNTASKPSTPEQDCLPGLTTPEVLTRDLEKLEVKFEYKLIPMGGGEKGKASFLANVDKMNNVPYLNEVERQKYKAEFREGLVYDSKRNLLGKRILGNKPIEYLYVMDEFGNFYIGDDKKVIHHSSFLEGGPVASAGHIVIQKGKVLSISNESGHYKPPEAIFQQAVTELKAKGISGFESKVWRIDQIKEH